MPLKSANGPVVTLTVSPTSKSGLNFGLSFLTSTSSLVPKILSTSLFESEIGTLPEPTKPITDGVFLISYQVVSSRSFLQEHIQEMFSFQYLLFFHFLFRLLHLLELQLRKHYPLDEDS